MTASELSWISETGSQAGVPAAVVSSRRIRRGVLAGAAIAGWLATGAALGALPPRACPLASKRLITSTIALRATGALASAEQRENGFLQMAEIALEIAP